MSTPFQNRLVGTVIVAAVAIIFLPDVLDGDKKTYQEQFEQVPAAPSIDFKPQNQAFPKEKLTVLAEEELVDEPALDDDSATDNLATSSEIKVNPVKKDETERQLTASEQAASVDNSIPAVKQQQLPSKAIANEAWVIQLGSFRHKNNVEELVNKLTKAGYTAFTRPIKTKTGTLTKVFVGPELIKASLEKKIPALKQLTNVEGKVARFSPTK